MNFFSSQLEAMKSETTKVETGNEPRNDRGGVTFKIVGEILFLNEEVTLLSCGVDCG